MKIASLCTGLLLLGMAAHAWAVPTTCVGTAGTNCPARIADAPQAALVSTMTVAAVTCPFGSHPVLSVAVDITHSAIGDLDITVANPTGATSTLLSNLQGSSGACLGSDVSAIFRDGGAAPACSLLIPSVSATTAPATPLAPLNATSPAGTWTLTVADTANNGDGALNDWSVDVACAQAAAAVPTPISWQVLAALAALLTLVAFVGLRRRRSSR